MEKDNEIFVGFDLGTIPSEIGYLSLIFLIKHKRRGDCQKLLGLKRQKL